MTNFLCIFVLRLTEVLYMEAHMGRRRSQLSLKDTE